MLHRAEEPNVDVYNDDKAWRATVCAQLIGIRNSVQELVLWMLLILILYLLSTYSVAAALCIACVLAAGCAVSVFSDAKLLQRLYGSIPR